MKFTTEIEKENKIAFLDILLIRNKDLVNTAVYRKKTNAEYINWKSFFFQTIGNGEHLKP